MSHRTPGGPQLWRARQAPFAPPVGRMRCHSQLTLRSVVLEFRLKDRPFCCAGVKHCTLFLSHHITLFSSSRNGNRILWRNSLFINIRFGSLNHLFSALLGRGKSAYHYTSRFTVSDTIFQFCRCGPYEIANVALRRTRQPKQKRAARTAPGGCCSVRLQQLPTHAALPTETVTVYQSARFSEISAISGQNTQKWALLRPITFDVIELW